jgi:hypothetical protein
MKLENGPHRAFSPDVPTYTYAGRVGEANAGCPRGVTCGTGVISKAIGALLGLGT